MQQLTVANLKVCLLGLKEKNNMSLDFELIDSSTTYSLTRLVNRVTTPSPELFLLQDFIDPRLLDKLYQFITTQPNLSWQLVNGQEYRTRKEICWEADTVIEEVHTVFENLTDYLNQEFNRNLKFNGISIWQDSPSYMYGRHKDIPIINLAIQIYMTSGYNELNTKFYYNDQILESVYQKNYEYLIDNSNFLEHGIDTPVPKKHIRYSLYCSWDKCPNV
jgi:hypothetical protein